MGELLPVKVLTYYAVARNERGEIGQLLVRIRDGRSSQKWTGVVYKTQREAAKDVGRLNGCR